MMTSPARPELPNVPARFQVEYRRRVFRHLNGLTWAMIAAYSIFYSVAGAYFSAVICATGALLISPWITWLERHDRLDTAKILFAVSCNYYVLFSNFGLNQSTGLEFFTIPMGLIGLLIFESSRLNLIRFCLAMPVLTWVVIEAELLVPLNFPIPASWVFKVSEASFLPFINFLGAFVVTILAISFFVKVVLESEKGYLTVFENIPVGAVQLNSSWHFLEANHAFRNWMGYTLEQLRTLSFHDLANAEDWSSLTTLRSREVRMRTSDGRIVWGRVSVRTMPSAANANDEIVFATIEDITITKKLELELLAQRKISDLQTEAINQCAIVEFVAPEGIVTYVNDHYCIVTGYSRDELVGRDHVLLGPRGQSKGPNLEMLKVVRSGESWRGESCEASKSGAIIWFDTWILPKLDEHGKIAQYSVVRYDITEKIKATESLNQTLSWQQALVDGTLYSVITMLPDGTISTFNKTAEIMLGYSAAEMVGVNTPFILHDPEEMCARALTLTKELNRPVNSNFEALIAKAALTGADINDWTYIRKNGSRFLARLCVTPMLNTEGEAIGYMGLAEDLTDTIKMQQTIDHQRAQMIATAKLSSLGEMAGSIAHEINNPLAIIKGKASLARYRYEAGTNAPGDTIRDLEKIEATADRIAKIIRGLRLFSRNSDQDPMQIGTLDSIVEETMELCRERMRNQEIDLRSNVPKGIKLECRSAQISQILMNLISNSFDAVHARAEKWIAIEANVKIDSVEISVTDSGEGIERAIRDRMMEPFFTTKGVGHGTGLGLSISRGIAEDHQGKLFYDEECKNTRIVLVLPLPVVDSDDVKTSA